MQTIHLHFHQRNDIPILFAKQKDVGRKFKAIISDGTEDYQIPRDAALSVWYSGTSGEGNYTSIGTERSAFAVEGNTVTVELIAQMLTNKGGGTLSLVMHSGNGVQLGLWNIPYIVEELPGAESAQAQQYYDAFSETVSQAMDAVKRAEELAGTFTVDSSLAVAGRAADAGAVGTALAGKAPAGYGLGEHSAYAADCHAITENGWYYTDISTLNAPPESEYGTILAKTRGDAIVLEYTDIDGGKKAQAVRTAGGTWNEWEWVNPPMTPGVEYRTTERYEGKPVFAIAVDLGYLPNAAEKEIAFSSDGAWMVIGLDGFATLDGVFYDLANNVWVSSFYATRTKLYVTTTIDASPYSSYAIVKYTKD